MTEKKIIIHKCGCSLRRVVTLVIINKGDEYHNLKRKYGLYSSWAIWNSKDRGDTLVINNNIDKLHSKYVFIGLNNSQLVDRVWGSFHYGPSNICKIISIGNKGKFKGSYMT